MISKITTLSRPKVLHELFFMSEGLAEPTSEGAREFFDIGPPMTEPVSPSGTIFLSLKRSFLVRNKASFLWASIPDNGGIRSGFLPYLSKSYHKSARMEFDLFSKILDQIDLLPGDCRSAVLEKRPSERFCNAIRGMVDANIVEGMLAQPMQAARRIEFCLGNSLTMLDEDIRFVQVPNTYKCFLHPKRAKFNPLKLFYYNPRASVLKLIKT